MFMVFLILLASAILIPDRAVVNRINFHSLGRSEIVPVNKIQMYFFFKPDAPVSFPLNFITWRSISRDSIKVVDRRVTHSFVFPLINERLYILVPLSLLFILFIMKKIILAGQAALFIKLSIIILMLVLSVGGVFFVLDRVFGTLGEHLGITYESGVLSHQEFVDDVNRGMLDRKRRLDELLESQ